MLKRPLIVLLVFFISLGVFAQSSPDWYIGKPIVDINFQGLDTISENDLLAVTDPFIGTDFTEPVFDDLLRRIYALDFFEIVLPDAIPSDDNESGVILQITVEERPVVSEINIQGSSLIRTEDILDVIVVKVGDMVSTAQLRIDTNEIIQYYRDEGFPEVEVEVDQELLELDEGRKIILTFTISEGPQTAIRTIQFSGNAFASDSSLKGVLKSAEQSLFNTGVFLEGNLQLDISNIEQYYKERGYIDAKVVDIGREFVLEEDDTRSYLTLTYFIEENAQWTYGGTSIEGNQLFTNEELLSLIKLAEGDVLNQVRYQAGYQAVADQYYQDGYIFNQIDLQESRDQINRIVNYTITVVERNRAYIENIIIRGNNKTKDNIVMRELPFEEGDVFSASKIREGIANLYNTQYFGSVPIVETPQGSAPGLMDLIITLEEQNTTDIRLGFSIGGDENFPVSGLIKFQDTNFLGEGLTFSTDLTFSGGQQRVALSFYDPFLFGDRFSGGVSFYVDRQLKTDQLQDILYPIFDGDTDGIPAVPDPYEGYYVFSQDTTISSTDYKAGDKFPNQPPTTSEIEDYNLVTDYEYAGGSTSVDDVYRMEYINWDFGLSFNTGVKLRTPIGWFGISGNIGTSLNYVWYDKEVYRPFNQEIRNNLEQLQAINRLGLTLSLDGRDIIFDPRNGYYISQGVTFTGGFLFGTRHYIRTDTTLQGFLTLWDVPVSDEWSFTGVLALNSSLSVLLPQFWVQDGFDTFEPGGSYLFTNGMTIARGWSTRILGEAVWNNWIELRMPLIDQVFSLDFFWEAVKFVEDRDNMFQPTYTDWMYGFGGGIRFTIPQLPIRLYLAKRYSFDGNGTIEWQGGNIFVDPDDSTSGLSFIFSISLF